ncbi:small integral membrane protein 26 [Chionomys nivalis]|uniref:small integral membrane protein 26 n=1 Tax=Chionomys nivalis TaxID=269649 RepID=UPI0025991C46|nr:small integral membrane protein 26 [Chionomys nivalis]
MRPERATFWYRRMSMVYAISAWGALGSAIFLTRRQKEPGYGEEQKDGWRDEAPLATCEDSDFDREISEPLDEPHLQTFVKNPNSFMSVTQRITDHLKSWIGGPGPQS